MITETRYILAFGGQVKYCCYVTDISLTFLNVYFLKKPSINAILRLIFSC